MEQGGFQQQSRKTVSAMRRQHKHSPKVCLVCRLTRTIAVDPNHPGQLRYAGTKDRRMGLWAKQLTGRRLRRQPVIFWRSQKGAGSVEQGSSAKLQELVPVSLRQKPYLGHGPRNFTRCASSPRTFPRGRPAQREYSSRARKQLLISRFVYRLDTPGIERHSDGSHHEHRCLYDCG